MLLLLLCVVLQWDTYLDGTKAPVETVTSFIVSGGQVGSDLDLLGLPDVVTFFRRREGDDSTCSSSATCLYRWYDQRPRVLTDVVSGHDE